MPRIPIFRDGVQINDPAAPALGVRSATELLFAPSAFRVPDAVPTAPPAPVPRPSPPRIDFDRINNPMLQATRRLLPELTNDDLNAMAGVMRSARGDQAKLAEISKSFGAFSAGLLRAKALDAQDAAARLAFLPPKRPNRADALMGTLRRTLGLPDNGSPGSLPGFSSGRPSAPNPTMPPTVFSAKVKANALLAPMPIGAGFPRGLAGSAAGSRPAPGTIPGQLPAPLPPEATKALHDLLQQLGRNATENTRRAIEQIRDLLGLPSEESGDEDKPAPRDETAETTPDQPPPPPPPAPPEPPKLPGELPRPGESRSRDPRRERTVPRGTPDNPVTLPRESKTVNQITAEDFRREFQPEGQIDPKRIGTTQRGISRVVRLDPSDPNSPEFRLERLVEALKSGEVKPEELEPVRIYEGDDGKMYTLDHRRVVATRLAGVQVRYRMATRKEMKEEIPEKDDRGSIPDGIIIIRGVPREN